MLVLTAMDTSMRMSLQHHNCNHKICEYTNGSGDSSRPLISSGSESSMCDVCSEIIQCSCSTGETELSSDEAYSSRSTCCTTLRWSSNSSCTGLGTSYISSASISADNESNFFTPSPSLTLLNNCIDNRRSILGLSSDTDSKTLPRTPNGNRCSWIIDCCNKCGRQHCIANGTGDCDAEPKIMCNNTIGTLTSSSDLRSVSPSSIHNHHQNHHHHHHHNFNRCIRKDPFPDRASLCSQSSHSSGASSNSNTSSGSGSIGGVVCSATDYSVPRFSNHQLINSLYDIPKNTSHNVCSLRSKSESSSLCCCHSNHESKGNMDNLSHENNSFHDGAVNPLMYYEVPRTALTNIYLKVSINCYLFVYS